MIARDPQTVWATFQSLESKSLKIQLGGWIQLVNF